MSTTDITEIGEDESPPTGAAGAAGAEGGAEGSGAAGAAGQQGQQGLQAGPQQGLQAGPIQPIPTQPPSQPSRNSPRLNDITINTIVPFVNEIGSALGEIKKNISSATYIVKKLDEIIPKIMYHYPSSTIRVVPLYPAM